MAMKGIEGTYEATFQLTLQLFITFTNLDRNPSIIQILSISFSFLSVTTSMIDTVFSLDPSASMITKGICNRSALIMHSILQRHS